MEWNNTLLTKLNDINNRIIKNHIDIKNAIFNTLHILSYGQSTYSHTIFTDKSVYFKIRLISPSSPTVSIYLDGNLIGVADSTSYKAVNISVTRGVHTLSLSASASFNAECIIMGSNVELK